MELLTYFQILRRRKWAVLITTFLTFAVAVVVQYLTPVTYTTSAVLHVIPYATDNPSYNQVVYADRIMKTYQEIGSGSIIMTDLRKGLGLTPDQPASVSIEIIPDTELLQVTIKDYDPNVAIAVANGLVAYLINDRTYREARVTLLEPASNPEPPSALSEVLLYALAFLIGLLGGVGLAFVLENIDTRMFDEKEVKDVSGLPTLGWLPSTSGLHSDNLAAEQYPYKHAIKRLSFTLQGVAKEKSLKTIMVTSSEPNEGKSTVAASLAYTLAETGYKTLLVDADQYRPAVHRYFSSPNKEGLSDLLHSDVTEKKAVSKTDVPGLSIITSGSMPENLDELLLAGEKIKKVLEQFSRQYDYVILDSPAFLGIVDSLILSPLVDGVLLVTRLGTTRSVSLKTTCQQLESVQAKIIGVVLNCVEDVYSTRYYRDRAVRKRTHILERLNREPIVELEKFSKEEGRAQLPTEAVSETL